MSYKNKKQRVAAFDVGRLIAALAVVNLHVNWSPLPGEIAQTIRLSSLFAVPYFFLLTGFFFTFNLDTRQAYFKDTMIRLFRIFLVWSAIYLPLVIYKYGWDEILTTSFLIRGSYFHLWFFESLIIGLATIYYFGLHRKPVALITLSIFIYVVFYLSFYIMEGYISELLVDLIRNFLSVPFLAMGIMLSKGSFKITLRLSWLLIAIGLIVQAGEVFFLNRLTGHSFNDIQFPLGTISYVLGVFSLAQHSPWFLKSKLLSRWGRDYTLGIYLMHPFVIIIVSDIANIYFTDLIQTNIFALLKPLVIVLISGIIVYVINIIGLRKVTF